MTVLLSVHGSDGVLMAADTVSTTYLSDDKSKTPLEWYTSNGYAISRDKTFVYKEGSIKIRRLDDTPFVISVAGQMSHLEMADAYYCGSVKRIIRGLREGKPQALWGVHHIASRLKGDVELFECYNDSQKSFALKTRLAKFDAHGFLKLPEIDFENETICYIDEIAKEAFKQLEEEHSNDGFGGFYRIHIRSSGIEYPDGKLFAPLEII